MVYLAAYCTHLAGMWTTLAPALIAATAALGGVTVGALVEPLKLGAARRARVREERAARCATLIETAMNCRAAVLALNLEHRRVASGGEADPSREDELLGLYRLARKEFRQTAILLRLCGPDTLVDAAMAVWQAERALRAAWITGDDGDAIDKDRPPKAVLEVSRGLESALHEFAKTARKLAV